jgi:putative tricarboxylic transport membrane protein
MKSDVAAGAIILVAGAAIGYEAHRIPAGIGDSFGAGTFPLMMGAVIAFCGLVILIGAVKKSDPFGVCDRVHWPVVWAAFLLLMGYTFSLAWLGFVLATAVLVPMLLLLFGVRTIAAWVAPALLIPAAAYLFFDLILGVDLPAGVLFGG